MFHLNRTRILDSDVFLFVLDGRVPDEGAVHGARHRLLPEIPPERREAPRRTPHRHPRGVYGGTERWCVSR